MDEDVENQSNCICMMEIADDKETDETKDIVLLRSDSPCTDSNSGKAMLDQLPEKLDTEVLLEVLGRKGEIKRTELNLIRCEPKRFLKSLRLIKILGHRLTQQPFLSALEESGQRHVANFIRNNGEPVNDCGDDWPLCVETMSRLDVIQRDTETLIPSDRLLWLLRKDQCISKYQYEVLINIPQLAQRAEELIEIIRRKSVASFKAILKCLNKDNQLDALAILDLENDYFGCRQKPNAAGDQCHINEKINFDDVLEPLLVRVVLMFREMRRTKPYKPKDAEKEAVTTVMKVCELWWHSLLSRSHTKWLLKKQLRLLPQVVASIKTKCRKIRGVALLEGMLFVIGRRSNDIKVFSTEPSFVKLTEIHVPLLKWPRDMVACAEQRSLFITDNCPETNCIWRVNVSPTLQNNTVTRWITIPRDLYEPWMMSGTSSRLVVLPWVGKSIYVYRNPDELPQVTMLPAYYDARHAIETENGDFIVADIEGPKNNAQEDRVTKVTAHGQEKHFYGKKRGNGPGQLSDPYHLALDSHGRVLVADHDNDRIILLNSDLTFCRQLLSREEDQQNGKRCRVEQQIAQVAEPRRLCYDKRSGLLAVGLQGGHVNLYHWKR